MDARHKSPATNPFRCSRLRTLRARSESTIRWRNCLPRSAQPWKQPKRVRAGNNLSTRQGQKGTGIVITNLADQIAEQGFIVRHFAPLHVPANQVAQNAAEVLVPREGHERA